MIMLDWHRYPVKNGYPWVAFVPNVGWFFIRRWVWAEDSPKPWEALHLPVRGKGRVERRMYVLFRGTSGSSTPEGTMRVAEAHFAEKYPLLALAHATRDICHASR